MIWIIISPLSHIARPSVYGDKEYLTRVSELNHLWWTEVAMRQGYNVRLIRPIIYHNQRHLKKKRKRTDRNDSIGGDLSSWSTIIKRNCPKPSPFSSCLGKNAAGNSEPAPSGQLLTSLFKRPSCEIDIGTTEPQEFKATQPCRRPRCKICAHIKTGNMFCSSTTKQSFYARTSAICKNCNVIYQEVR